MSSVAVIDYGMGNLHSIAKALEYVGSAKNIWITSKREKILNADRVVFPGVGAIRDCMKSIRRMGLDHVLEDVFKEKPLLGICLGLQALLDESEENEHTPCLGLMKGCCVHFAEGATGVNGTKLKIPHMGWNQVHQRIGHPLWQNIPQDSRFYFVHSYYARPQNPADIAATTEYPSAFACALARENLFAVQFHPEKSQAAGLQLLRNFLAWQGEY